MKLVLALLFIVLLAAGRADGQVAILFCSNWTGTGLDVATVMSLLFNNYNCLNQNNPQGSFSLVFPTPGLSFSSPISVMNNENLQYTGAGVKFQIGEVNNLINFIYPPTGTNFIQIQQMYPTDTQIVNLVIAIINAIFNPNVQKQDILVILVRSNDINNLNVSNYENVIKQINQLNWMNVQFLDYQSAENVIYQLRRRPYYNIITLLADPSNNRDLVQKAFNANLMVWRYRWLIVNLLGEYNLLSDTTQFGSGVMTNNVTIVTFADVTTGKTGRAALLEDSLRLVRTNVCDTTQPYVYDGLTGTLIISTLGRQSFKFAMFRNQGVNVSIPTYINMDQQLGTISFVTPIAYVPFTMNVSTSRAAMQQKVFRIGYVLFPPYSYKDGNNDSGFVMDILIKIMGSLNVTYKVIDLSSQFTGLNTGTINSSLVYSQLLGLVQNNVVDTLSFPFIINTEMQSFFDFTTSIQPGYISVLYKNRTLTSVNALLTYTLPLQWQVWVTFFCSALGVAIALTISDAVFPDKMRRYRFLMSLFFSFSSLTHGAYFDPPKRIGGRIIMSFWWMFCLVVVIIWACNYAAFLAQKNYSQQLNTVFSLLNQGVYAYGTLNDSILFNFLSKNNQSDPQSMLQIMSEDMPNGTVPDFSSAVNLVINNNYAFIHSDLNVKYLRNFNCLDMFGNWMGFEYGLLLPRNSEKTLAINDAIVKLRANGDMDKLIMSYWPVYNNTCASMFFLDVMNAKLQSILPNFFTNALDIRLMIGIFLIIIGGSICCLILSAIERAIRKLIQIRKDKNDMYDYDRNAEELNRF